MWKKLHEKFAVSDDTWYHYSSLFLLVSEVIILYIFKSPFWIKYDIVSVKIKVNYNLLICTCNNFHPQNIWLSTFRSILRYGFMRISLSKIHALHEIANQMPDKTVMIEAIKLKQRQ